jgi:hypothetical protein
MGRADRRGGRPVAQEAGTAITDWAMVSRSSTTRGPQLEAR